MELKQNKFGFIVCGLLIAALLASCSQIQYDSTREDPKTVYDNAEKPAEVRQPELEKSKQARPTVKSETLHDVDTTNLAGAVSPETQRRVSPPGSRARRDGRLLPDLANLPRVTRYPGNTMYFKHYGVNPTIDTREQSTSTFSVDVDTASYRIAKAFLARGKLPDEASVRVEEFINYFDYDYKIPRGARFSLFSEIFPSPHRKGYHVLHIGLQGKKISHQERKPANLVFVVDVSGSMQGANRLGLLKRSLNYLAGQLNGDDYVSIVAFNQRAKVILPPTSGSNLNKIERALNNLVAGGSTNVQAGLELGYNLVQNNFRRHGTNRVILVSDGVANTGLIKAGKIFRAIEQEAENGIALVTIGIGMGNFNDVLLEKLAQKGQGHYSYINHMRDARELFGRKLLSQLLTVAKDVKLQIEFNPNEVSRYRLLGYENRRMANKDFANDRKDAGEMGAGHTVTAMYEIKLARHSSSDAVARPVSSLARLRLRYKLPRTDRSRLIEKNITSNLIRNRYRDGSRPARLSYLAATFAEKLRRSYWVRHVSYDQLWQMFNELPARYRFRKKVVELGKLITQAKLVDTRSDKFEQDRPIANMDFDRVPILK